MEQLKLPSYILDALRQHKTSLGDHPSYPPEDEEKFIVKAVSRKFTSIMEELGDHDLSEVPSMLDKLTGICSRTEETDAGTLEDIARAVICNLFNVPDDTIELVLQLIPGVDVSSHRELPEPTDDFEFGDIDDMASLTDEVYKRRMLNALTYGAAIYYASDISLYGDEVKKINPKLVALYNDYNILAQAELYCKGNERKNELHEGYSDSNVDLYISGDKVVPKIIASGAVFPLLLMEGIKGILELAISHGLPDDLERTQYILKKADFSLADRWDKRIGLPLWELIMKMFKKINVDMSVIEPNFYLMAVSRMEPEMFNNYLQNVFMGTRKGAEMTAEICDKIMEKKDMDDFNDFIDMENNRVQICDNYITSGELNEDGRDFGTTKYYRGFTGDIPHKEGGIWLTPDPLTALYYIEDTIDDTNSTISKDAHIAEYIIDDNLLSSASLDDVEEICGYPEGYFEGIDGLKDNDKSILMDNGYNSYEFATDSDDILYLFDPKPIKSMRLLSDGEVNQLVKEYLD